MSKSAKLLGLVWCETCDSYVVPKLNNVSTLIDGYDAFECLNETVGDKLASFYHRIICQECQNKEGFLNKKNSSDKYLCKDCLLQIK